MEALSDLMEGLSDLMEALNDLLQAPSDLLESFLWAAAPKGIKSCRIQGESVHLYMRLSMRSSLPPWRPFGG